MSAPESLVADEASESNFTDEPVPQWESLEERLSLSVPYGTDAGVEDFGEESMETLLPDAESEVFVAYDAAPGVSSRATITMPLSFRMDMVHHNPGDARTQSEFLDPSHLQSLGYTTQVMNDFPQAAVTYDSFDRSIFPDRSAARQWVLNRAVDIDGQIQAAHAAGLKIYYWTDFVVLPKAMVNKYRTLICNSSGKIDISRSTTQTILRVMIAEMFARFPGIDGLVIRTGECYTQDTPYHTGNNPILNGVSSHLTLIKLLRSEVCVNQNKLLVYRTWDTNGTSGFHANANYYLAVTNAVAPHTNLIFSIKEPAGDFHRMVPFNPTLGIGQHRQIVEVQCQREYEGKGSSPNYIGKGVIDGWEEYGWMNPAGRPDGLRDLVANPRFAGVWTWSRGGGWDGPYLKDDLWTDLNAYVVSAWANNPARSEESLFYEFASTLGLTGTQASQFRQLCLMSADAVLRGRLSTSGGVPLFWTRDQYIGGLPLLKDYFRGVINAGKVTTVLAEKAGAVAKWRQMEALSTKITLNSPSRTEFLRTSTTYGRIQYEIFQQAWAVMLYGLKGDMTGTYDRAKIDAAIVRYDALWREWRNLKNTSPTCATLYTDQAFRGDAAKGVGASINRYRKSTTPVTPSAGVTTLQAESASLAGAIVAKTHSGYSGSGYVDYQNTAGDYIRWNITAAKAGKHDLGFRYANAAGQDRPLELKVNGVVTRGRLSFPGTGSWTTWQRVSVTVDLKAGLNSVQLTTIGASGPNVDRLEFRPI